MKAKTFNAELRRALAVAEQQFLTDLIALYTSVLKDLASSAKKQFGLTAAAEWHPPAEGATLTAAALGTQTRLLVKNAQPIWREILFTVGRDVRHPLIDGQIEKTAQRIGRRIEEAVKPVLQKTIQAGYESGLSVEQTAAKISEVLGNSAPWQAEMLARTDFTSLANGAAKSVARLSGMEYKTWVATLDATTRPEHADAHGDIVPINGTFLVGGEEADYPGDPNLSDAMAANCRCTMVFGSTLEETGALLADGGGMMGDVANAKQRRRSRRAAKPQPVLTIEAGENGADDRVIEALVAGAVAVHHTSVVAGTWDGNAAMGKASSAADYRSICAWFETGADLSQRQSWKFPHHATPGGPANVNGVRNALARVPQADIPDGDRAGVIAHLRAHLNDFNRKSQNAVEGFDDLSLEDALAAVDERVESWSAEAWAAERALVADARPIGIHGIAMIEGKISDDSSLAPRVIIPNALTWEEMPRPFMAQTVTAEGHDGAEVAGRIDEFARKKATGRMHNIAYTGELTTPFGINEIAPMIDDKTMRYVSADLGAVEWAIVDRKTLKVIPEEDLNQNDLMDGKYALGATVGKIKALTLVPTQAIEGATVALTAAAEEYGCAFVAIQDGDEEIWRVVFPVEDLALTAQEAMVAAAAPRHPPREWFETPELPGRTPLTVLPDGRVYGHLATWDSCHMSFLPSCVPPPKSASNYSYFHVCELDTEEGDVVTVGKLMFSPTDGGHADRRISASKASAYYDRTGMAAAYLRVTDGAHGIWAAGALNPAMTDEQRQEMRRELRLHPPSGDWRPVNGQYELICALAVAVPGFPTPRATISVTASADGFVLEDAIIASSGAFDPDPQALYAAERAGIADPDVLAEREMRALAARAEGGMEALVALVGGDE